MTDIPKLIEQTPLPYLTPLSKEMVRALQSVGEDKLVDMALYKEFQKGASQVRLMSKYGITRNRLYVMHQQDRLLLSQLCLTFPSSMDGARSRNSLKLPHPSELDNRTPPTMSNRAQFGA